MTPRTGTGFGLPALLLVCTLAAAQEYPILTSPEPSLDPMSESFRQLLSDALRYQQRSAYLHSTRIIERRGWEGPTGASSVSVPIGEAVTSSAPAEGALHIQYYRPSKRVVPDLLAAFKEPGGSWTGALHDDNELARTPQPDVVSDGFFLFLSSTDKGLWSDVYWNEAGVAKGLVP